MEGEGFTWLKQKAQLLDIGLFLLIYAILYFVIQINYPYPDITPDSGSYLSYAYNGSFNVFRPLGYSFYIKFFHGISATIGGLFVCQFIFNLISTIFFLLTIKYVLKPNYWVYMITAISLICSPSVLYCTNLIMSESVFNSLTLLYLATLIWFLKKPNLLVLALHFIIMYQAINLRYIALLYPIISSIAIVVVARKKLLYLIALFIPIFLVIKMVNDTKANVKKAVGINEFSGFNGWARANNAIAVLPYIDKNKVKFSKPELNEMHAIIASFPDSNYTVDKILGTNFMWNNGEAGKTLLYKNIQEKKYNYPQAWVYTGKRLNEYGTALIKKYPFAFFNHFILENTKQIFGSYSITPSTKFEPFDILIDYYKLKPDVVENTSTLITAIDPYRKGFVFLLLVLGFLSIPFLIYLMVKQKNKTWPAEPVLILILFVLAYVGASVVGHPINNFRYFISLYPALHVLVAVAISSILFFKNWKLKQI